MIVTGRPALAARADDTRLDEVAVELPGKRTQQCDSLEAKQICQRVLVGHEGTVARHIRNEPTAYDPPGPRSAQDVPAYLLSRSD